MSESAKPSTLDQLAALPPPEAERILAAYPEEQRAQLLFTWSVVGRPDQQPPEGSFRTWTLLGGRGSGKTRTGAEYVRAEIERGNRKSVGLVSRTMDSTRRTMVEGDSGLCSIAPPWFPATYERSREIVRWPNGAIAHLFGAERPDLLRGPNLDLLWIDEACAIENIAEVWDVAQMALRQSGADGSPARCIVSTTPKPSQWLRELMADPTTITTRSRTRDNAVNLDRGTLAYLTRKYANRSIGRQELDAELLENVDGALWQREWIESSRVNEAPPLVRIVVAVDPSVSASGAETGVIVAGKAADGDLYVLADNSLKGTPEQWARRAVDAYELHEADVLVAEANQGGLMVQNTLQVCGHTAPVKLVHASRGKATRAEPIAALYEQGRVHHVGAFPVLEDQLCSWVPGDRSPDRLDALVWACTELALGKRREPPAFMVQYQRGIEQMRRMPGNFGLAIFAR